MVCVKKPRKGHTVWMASNDNGVTKVLHCEVHPLPNKNIILISKEDDAVFSVGNLSKNLNKVIISVDSFGIFSTWRKAKRALEEGKAKRKEKATNMFNNLLFHAGRW